MADPLPNQKDLLFYRTDAILYLNLIPGQHFQCTTVIFQTLTWTFVATTSHCTPRLNNPRKSGLTTV